MTGILDSLLMDDSPLLQAGRSAPGPNESVPRTAHVALDPEAAARDLACLVLTVVELLRQLMERQALRRIDQGDLGPDREERLGTALMLLDQRMTELCDHHGLRRNDLNLDLGPLGSLLANDW
jgi:hypothetical protein